MHAQIVPPITIFPLACMRVLTHTYTPLPGLYSSRHVKRHVNISAFKRGDVSESIIWLSLTHSISSPRQNAVAMQHQKTVFSAALAVQIDLSAKLRYQSFFCNTSKDLSTLSTHFQTLDRCTPPSLVTQSQHHTSLSSAPPACFRSLPPSKQCPRSRPFQLIVRWPCKKRERRSFGFNYSCAMRGSGSSPLQAKK